MDQAGGRSIQASLLAHIAGQVMVGGRLTNRCRQVAAPRPELHLRELQHANLPDLQI